LLFRLLSTVPSVRREGGGQAELVVGGDEYVEDAPAIGEGEEPGHRPVGARTVGESHQLVKSTPLWWLYEQCGSGRFSHGPR
jgi:hypothetical protein